MLPTPALSGSGLRVAGLPASQPFITAPRMLKSEINQETTFRVPPVKNPCV